MRSVLSVLLSCLSALVAGAESSAPGSGEDSRLSRRAALVRELLDEDSAAEAASEYIRFQAEFPGEAASKLPEIPFRLAKKSPSSAPAEKPRGGPGVWLASAVVGFYRIFVGPAIGSRCALEPSCSRYFTAAAKKHGLLGVPLLADRFVREPVASASEEWVLTADNEWRHSDPVEAHDFWMTK